MERETSARRFRIGPAIVVILVFIAGAAAQSSVQNNGTIVERTNCPERTAGTYDEYVQAAKAAQLNQIDTAKKGGVKLEMPPDFLQRLFSREEFERRRGYSDVECQRIKYVSDGLKVVGYIWKPKRPSGNKLPLVIFNRGGNRERSKLTPWMADGFYDFVSNGFVVIASQYRGVDGGEGKEEYGGADVRDVLSLIPLAASLGYVDMNNVFMFGHSRGGMMSYLALKAGIPVNAAAVTSGVADLFGNAKDHPELVATIYRDLVPNFDRRRDDAMHERSAVAWAEKIDAPLLLIHGSADMSISAARTLGLAQRLQELGKTYELIVYAGDGHGLLLNKKESDRRVVEWFKRHLK